MPPPGTDGLRGQSPRSNGGRATLDALSPKDRLLVALDVSSLAEADQLMERLDGVVSGCKIGSQLFTAAGPAAVEHAQKRGLLA